MHIIYIAERRKCPTCGRLMVKLSEDNKRSTFGCTMGHILTELKRKFGHNPPDVA